MRKLWLLGFVMLMSLGANGGGCGSNPNAIGVQQYGNIVGRVLDATNNRPVSGVLISVGSLYTTYSDPNGAFSFANIPIGTQNVTANAPGYSANTVQAHVREKQTSNVGYLRSVVFSARGTMTP
jgi:hypothetical protein